MPGTSATAKSLAADVGRGVPARNALRTARSVVKDFGSAACPTLQKLSLASDKKSDACQRIMYTKVLFSLWVLNLRYFGVCNIVSPMPKEEAVQREFRHLRLQVPITEDGDVPVPILKATDFVRCIDKYGFWDKLFGENSLSQGERMCSDFWVKYRKLHPDFQLFGRGLPLQRCLPILLHGDEGTHYKKGAVMICQWQSVIGTGTTLNNANVFGNLSQKKYYVNQKRATLSTRFLLGVMPKES